MYKATSDNGNRSKMNINSKTPVSITKTNQNFSKVARLADETGGAEGRRAGPLSFDGMVKRLIEHQVQRAPPPSRS